MVVSNSPLYQEALIPFRLLICSKIPRMAGDRRYIVANGTHKPILATDRRVPPNRLLRHNSPIQARRVGLAPLAELAFVLK